MSKFGFLGLGSRRGVAPAPSQSIEIASDGSAGSQPSMAGVEAITARTMALRTRLHKHLTATSRDYAALASIKASKVEYCDQVTQEVIRRLAGNPFFEVLQDLDAAQAQIRMPGARTMP